MSTLDLDSRLTKTKFPEINASTCPLFHVHDNNSEDADADDDEDEGSKNTGLLQTFIHLDELELLEETICI